MGDTRVREDALAEAAGFGAAAKRLVESSRPLDVRLRRAVILTLLLLHAQDPLLCGELVAPWLMDLLREP